MIDSIKKDTLTQGRDKLSCYICVIRKNPRWQPCIRSRNHCHGMKRKIGNIWKYVENYYLRLGGDVNRILDINIFTIFFFSFFFFFFLIGGQLFYSSVLVPAIQQCESAISIIYLLSPKPPPSHPSRSSQSTELSSIYYTANSHWLSILPMVVHISQF